VIDRTDTFTVPITFEKAQFNTRNVDNILQGTLTLSKGTSWIIGREGGTITASNGAEIIVPENALLVPVTVNIRKLTIDEIPATNVLDAWNGIKSTKIAFEFLPDYLDFRRPVKIRIPWTTTELQYSKVEDSSKLKVYFWNHKSLAWERVGGHVNGNTVETDIDHFTIYMLVEDRQVLAPAASEIEFSPNPFSPNANGWNDVTNLSFILGNDADVTVEIYDVRGIKQRVVADRRRMFSGINKVEWDGRDDFGQILRTGIYIYRFRALETDGSLVTNQGTIVISTNLKDW
jgi:hypothetical protein